MTGGQSLSKATDMDIHGAGANVVRLSPDGSQQIGPGAGPVAMANECFKDSTFDGG
jgi:hypothetical protein